MGALINKCVFGFLFFGLLGGCDNSEHNDVTLNRAGGSNTAIYFRGGAGVDFGVAPKADILGVEAGNNYRMVSYELKEDPNLIDEAIRPILEGAGYKRTVKNTAGVSLNAWYEIPEAVKKDFVNVRYIVSVDRGLVKITTVYLSWYYDD